jgi:Co/Zn/Cd efflux system component
MHKTTFRVAKMDCPSEENLIRLKLEPLEHVAKLEFDLEGRSLFVYHEGDWKSVQQALASLDLGDDWVQSEAWERVLNENDDQKKLLWTVLAINLAFFFIEITTGFISDSMGLVADSLDMLADAFVYAISLMAVGASLIRKKQVAKIAGYLEVLLALIGFTEVLRRFFGHTESPNVVMMPGVASLALAANAICLWLLQRSRSKEAHMQASMIFTSNDVIINLGVILAAGLVWWTQSAIPDLLIGAIVFVLVLRGARRILMLGK